MKRPAGCSSIPAGLPKFNGRFIDQLRLAFLPGALPFLGFALIQPAEKRLSQSAAALSKPMSAPAFSLSSQRCRSISSFTRLSPNNSLFFKPSITLLLLRLLYLPKSSRYFVLTSELYFLLRSSAKRFFLAFQTKSLLMNQQWVVRSFEDPPEPRDNKSADDGMDLF